MSSDNGARIIHIHAYIQSNVYYNDIRTGGGGRKINRTIGHWRRCLPDVSRYAHATQRRQAITTRRTVVHLCLFLSSLSTGSDDYPPRYTELIIKEMSGLTFVEDTTTTRSLDTTGWLPLGDVESQPCVHLSVQPTCTPCVQVCRPYDVDAPAVCLCYLPRTIIMNGDTDYA